MSNLTIREPQRSDIPALQPIFEQWIRDRVTGDPLPDEVEAIKDSVRSSIAGQSTQEFLVAEQAGQMLGIMGIQPPTKEMQEFTTTPRPTELITALVSDESRSKGVGRALVSALTEKALAGGSTELIVNSGPRYQTTGWPFWKKLFGEPVGVAKSYYGPGGDAMVWHRDLSHKKVTFFAVDPTDPTGESITFGRGDPDDPNSLASDAFVSVETTDTHLHESILANLDEATQRQQVIRDNAVQVLNRAVELAKKPRS